MHRTNWQPSEGRGVGETGWKKVKGLVKEHICVNHRHRKQVITRGRGQESGAAGKGRGNGDICKGVNNTNKVKK